MALSSTLRRRACLLVLVLAGSLCGNAHAGPQTIDAGEVYEQNSRWLVVGGLFGKACSLGIWHGADEILLVLATTDRGRLSFGFSYMKKGLNISQQGNYVVRIKYNNGDFFVGAAKAIEQGPYSGLRIENFVPDFIADFASNSSFSLKVGDVVYGTYDLTRSRDGIPRLFECMMDTVKWDVTSSVPFRGRIGP